jgi:hypothetical protein
LRTIKVSHNGFNYAVTWFLKFNERLYAQIPIVYVQVNFANQRFELCQKSGGTPMIRWLARKLETQKFF